MTQQKSIAVLMGGWSTERDVSLVSGQACAAALRTQGYDVRVIDVTRDLNALITALTPKPDVVFNALHGRYGEDGCIQGVLEILEIPYTHSGPLASALAMDKHRAKAAVAGAGVPCAAGVLLDIDRIRAGDVPLDPPYVIKPNTEGSSVGVFIVREGDNKPPLGLDRWQYGPQALVERFVPGRELSVAVMATSGVPAALAVTEITTANDFYDYEAKYASGGSRHTVPAQIADDVAAAARHFAEIAHEKLGCAGVSRTDFRYNDAIPGAEGLFYLETNTQPGMTPTSLVPEQAAYRGIGFGALVAKLVEAARLHT